MFWVSCLFWVCRKWEEKPLSVYLQDITPTGQRDKINRFPHSLLPVSFHNFSERLLTLDSGKMESVENFFQMLQKIDTKGASIVQYKCQRTGMQLVVVDPKKGMAGPMVFSSIAVAFDDAAFDDDALATAHALQHLVLMGSSEYPCKGQLQAQVDNALGVTTVDTNFYGTVFSLSTAASQGFEKMLHVFLDHILKPTLTDAAFKTEIHHINGNGIDNGFIYSKFRDCENLPDEILSRAMYQRLYFNYFNRDSFRHETSGLTTNLRALTAEDIRNSHRNMYKLHNIRVIVFGQVNHEALLEIMTKFTDDVVHRVPTYSLPSKGLLDSPALTRTTVDTVEFPEEDDSAGMVQITFIGPDSTDVAAEHAVYIIIQYLISTTFSRLVAAELASSIDFKVLYHRKMVVCFAMAGVPPSRLAEAKNRFFEVLTNHVSGQLDMDTLKQCLSDRACKMKYFCEDDPKFHAETIIVDHLFGNRNGFDLSRAIASSDNLKALEGWTEDRWRKYMVNWLVNSHHVSLLGKPSIALAEELKKKEAARIQEQQKEIGEAGMKKLMKDLEDAQAQVDMRFSNEFVSGLCAPGIDSIPFFEMEFARSGLAKSLGSLENEVQATINQDENGSPLFIVYQNIPTTFVRFGVIISTTSLSRELQPLLGVYLTNLSKAPIMNEVKHHVLKYDFDVDGKGLSFLVKAEEFNTSVEYLARLLSYSDLASLLSTVEEMLADNPHEADKGESMCSFIDDTIHYERSADCATNTLIRRSWLGKILESLKRKPQDILERLQLLRKELLDCSNLRFFVVGDIMSMNKPVQAFNPLMQLIKTDKEYMEPVGPSLSNHGINPGGVAYIVPMVIDTCFAVLTCLSNSAMLPALLVAQAFLNAHKGTLPDGTYLDCDVETGLLKLQFGVDNAYLAYTNAKTAIESCVRDREQIEALALRSAINSVVRAFVKKRETIMAAAHTVMVDNVWHGLDHIASLELLRRVSRVCLSDMYKALEVVKDIFDPEKANLVVTCGEAISHELQEKFQRVGFAMKVKELADFQREME